MKKRSIIARRRARYFGVQALYQWECNPRSAGEIIATFLAQSEMVSVDTDFFARLVQEVIAAHEALDEVMQPFLLKSDSTIHPAERAILRMETYELQMHLEIPYRVILNEAIELAKTFGALGSYKYVNGILHELAKQYRRAEIKT